MSKPSITPGPGPFVFGGSYTTEEVVGAWVPRSGKQPDGGYWARIDCSQDGHVVYAQFADLTPPTVQSGFTFGPTPSWSGGPASCQLRLATMNDGAIRYIATSETFPAEG
jgi:hypothetical protein